MERKLKHECHRIGEADTTAPMWEKERRDETFGAKRIESKETEGTL
jgi:hypothetical protein